VHPQAQLQGAVIGEGVTIDKPIRVLNSILLPGTHVSSSEAIEDCILSKDIRIHCPPAKA